MLEGCLSAEFRPAPDGVTLRARAAPLEIRGPFAGAALPRYFLRNVTAGLLAGDACRIEVVVRSGARVRIEPTSAAKVFVAGASAASTVTTLEVEPGACLEYDSGLLIPHAGSVLHQRTEVVLHPGATVAYADVLSFGRLARGERFAFERLVSEVAVVTPEGDTLFEKRSDLRPPRHRAALAAAVGAHGALGVLLLLGGAAVEWLDAVSERLVDAAVYAGASVLPREAGVIVQVLAGRPEAVAEVLARALEVARVEAAPGAPLVVA